MKSTPLIPALWALCSFIMLSIPAWSANETTNTLAETYNCTISLAATPIGVYCGEATGSIDVKITGGTAPYKIEWDNNDSSIWAEISTNNKSYTIPNLPRGMYMIKIRDANGCRDQVSVMMDDNASDLTYTIEPNDPCAVSGSMIIRVAGADAPYWVILDGPTSGGVIANSNSFRIDNLLPGAYKVTVDKEGCGHDQTTNIITTPTNLGISIAQMDNNVCDEFGDVKVNITGGTSEYLISWYGASSGSTRATESKVVQNLVPGDYTFTIRDANFCTSSATVTVVSTGTDLYCELTQTPVVCDNMGQVGVTIKGGKAGYTVAYSGPISGSLTANSQNNNTGDASIWDLPPGEYHITITDSRGCVAKESIVVGGELTDLACIVTQTPVLCDNMGQIGVAISGGQPTYRVEYTGPVSGSLIATTIGDRAANASILDLPAGHYTIKVIDSRGCLASESIIVGGMVTDLACIVTQTPVLCDDMGQIGVAINGGYPTYRIDYSGPRTGSVIATTTGDRAGNGSILDLPAGYYTIVVTDSRGCSATESITVGGSTTDLACIVTQTPVLCDDMGQIGVAINGGYPTYRIDYSGPRTGSVIATTTGDRAGNGSILDLPAGYYTIVVTDSRGCSATESITVGSSTTDLACIVTQTPVLCDDMGQIGVAINGGYPTYRIDYSGPRTGSVIATTTGDRAGNGSILDLPAGYYTIVVTDSRGCSATETITVGGSITDLACVVRQTPVLCGNMGEIGVSITGGYPTYRIDYSGPKTGAIIAATTGDRAALGNISGLPAGYYTIVVTDSRGCSATERITVEETGSDMACVMTPHAQICNTMGGVAIAISGGTPQYQIKYTGPISGVVTATGSGMTNISDLPAGNYTVIVVDGNGCSITESIIIGDDGSNLSSDVLAQPQICESNAGVYVTISGGKPSYAISYTGAASGNVVTTGGTTFIPLPFGNYTITVVDGNGCTTSESATVGAGTNDLHCRLIQTHAICHKPGAIEVIISGGKPGFTVTWTAANGESNTAVSPGYNYKFNVPSPGIYEIKVIDANGCVVMEATEVKQLENNLAYELFANSGIQEGNGWIEVYFQQGRASYTVELTGPSNQTQITNGPIVLSSLPSGQYSVNITDANGCEKQTYIVVPQVESEEPEDDGMRVNLANENPIGEEQLKESQAEANGKTALTPFIYDNQVSINEFVVYQNYPNPFKLSTTISFNLPQSMKATITIQDHFGKTITSVENDFVKGYNQYELNRTDLGTGVYYYTVSAGTFSKTTRMLHIE